MSKVYLIAKTELTGEHNRYLKETYDCDMEDHPEALLEFAGRLCYRSFREDLNPNVTRIRPSNEYVANIVKVKHYSVLEHINLTFLYSRVTRVFTHELVRHRISSFSQESLRYVRLRNLGYYIPTGLEEMEPYLKKHFKQSEELVAQLEDHFDIDNQTMARKKELTSAFRRLIPMGIETNIVWTANLRTLREVFEKRISPAAEIEIREVMSETLRICKEEYPNVFEDCLYPET